MYVLSKKVKSIKFFLVKFSIFTAEKKISVYCMGVFSFVKAIRKKRTFELAF